MFKILAIVLVFGALVFFHELGHLIFAKRAGILCREFALGMGPKLFSYKWGETTYTLRLFPIGGFVRMAGEDPEIVKITPGQQVALVVEQGYIKKIIADQFHKYPHAQIVTVQSIDLERKLQIEATQEGSSQSWQVDRKADIVVNGQHIQIAPIDRQFGSKTVRQRGMAILAGPMANFLLAFVLLTSMGAVYGTPADTPILGKVNEEGAAFKAGLREGDRVIKVGDKQVSTWMEIVDIVSKNPSQQLTFLIERDKVQYSVPVTPDQVQGTGKIGVYQPMTSDMLQAVRYGGETTWFFSTIIFKGFGMLVSGKVSMDELSGPVGIFKVTGEQAERGIAVLLRWAAILSINLGIMNLLPLPALDGGRLVFLAVEALRGRPVDPQKEGMVHFLGFAFLMLLMLVITWNDIQRLFL